MREKYTEKTKKTQKNKKKKKKKKKQGVKKKNTKAKKRAKRCSTKIPNPAPGRIVKRDSETFQKSRRGKRRGIRRRRALTTFGMEFNERAK